MHEDEFFAVVTIIALGLFVLRLLWANLALKKRLKLAERSGPVPAMAAPAPAPPTSNREVEELRHRVQVLERITVDKENSLAREIENLRERP